MSGLAFLHHELHRNTLCRLEDQQLLSTRSPCRQGCLSADKVVSRVYIAVLVSVYRAPFQYWRVYILGVIMGVLRLMIKILHYFKGPTLRKLWYSNAGFPSSTVVFPSSTVVIRTLFRMRSAKAGETLKREPKSCRMRAWADLSTGLGFIVFGVQCLIIGF